MENRQFEVFVMIECNKALRNDLGVYRYAKMILDELWDGEGYGNYYYEIPKEDTRDGNGYVVSIQYGLKNGVNKMKHEFFELKRDVTEHCNGIPKGVAKVWEVGLIKQGEATYCCSITPSSWFDVFDHYLELEDDAEWTEDINEYYWDLGTYNFESSCYIPYTEHNPEDENQGDLFEIDDEETVGDWTEWQEAIEYIAGNPTFCQ